MKLHRNYKTLMLLIVLVCLLCVSGCTIILPEAPSASEDSETLSPSLAPAPTTVPEDTDIGKLVITELMGKNRSFLLHSDGNFYDWVEIRNDSDEVIELGAWKISKNGSEHGFSTGKSLAPGEYAVVFVDSGCPSGGICSDFGFGLGDTLSLVTPAGNVSGSVEYTLDEKNISLALDKSGSYARCVYPTPGFENSAEGYGLYCEQDSRSSPVIISEIVGDYSTGRQCNTGYEDWIELKNVSDQPVELSDFYLSDDYSNLKLFSLPQYTLRAGSTLVIWCSGDSENTENSYYHSDFKIDGENEALFLCNSEGVVDYAAYHDVPVNGSMGRIDGENGWFIFEKTSLNTKNEGGYRQMLSAPRITGADGVFNDVESVTVELYGEGDIYYTTDGTAPTAKSKLYSSPITLTKTSVVMAVSVKDGVCKSPVSAFSYIINENHALPVLSIVADEFTWLKSAYWQSSVDKKIPNKYPGTISYYESDNSFSRRCKICMKGWTSLNLPKKSLGVSFSGSEGSLEYDIFGTGTEEFSKLSIRAGQDYTFAVIRNELLQELCLEATDNVPTQRSQYCVLYLNGEYWGLYCLKDDVSSSFYSSWSGSSEVVKNRSPAQLNSAVNKEAMQYCVNNDMSLKPNYDYFCSVFDINNLIDWIILEGYSANTDIGGNMRYFKPADGKWQIVFYDLDWALTMEDNAFVNILKDTKPQIYVNVIRELLKNEDFCDALCRRGAELLRGALSDESALRKIDELKSIIEPEMPRERDRWSLNMNAWYGHIEKLNTLIGSGWAEKCLSKLFKLANAGTGLYEEFNVK